MQCEKGIECGEREGLPKILRTKLDEQKYGREDKALEKASSPVKKAETAPTPTTTDAKAFATGTTLAKSSADEGKRKATSL